MARVMMRSSATNSTVKRMRKRKKVSCTEPVCSFETAAVVGIRSWMTHGCRPASATIQPDWLATKANGMVQRQTVCSQRCDAIRFFRPSHNTRRNMSTKYPPSATIT